MFLTPQEVIKIEKNLEEIRNILANRQTVEPFAPNQNKCEEVIGWMVHNYDIDGMVTRAFIDEYLRLCEEKGIPNILHDTAIPKIVKKYGFSIISKKIMGNKWRIFIREEQTLNPEKP